MTSLRSCLCFSYFLHCSSVPTSSAADPLQSASCHFLLLVLFSCAFVFSERVLPGALAPLTELQETGQGILSLPVPRESQSLGMGLARRSLAPSTPVASSAADSFPLTSAKPAFIALGALPIHPVPRARGRPRRLCFRTSDPEVAGEENRGPRPGFVFRPSLRCCGLPALSTDSQPPLPLPLLPGGAKFPLEA